MLCFFAKKQKREPCFLTDSKPEATAIVLARLAGGCSVVVVVSLGRFVGTGSARCWSFALSSTGKDVGVGAGELIAPGFEKKDLENH